jgi:hypothetical protein
VDFASFIRDYAPKARCRSCESGSERIGNA